MLYEALVKYAIIDPIGKDIYVLSGEHNIVYFVDANSPDEVEKKVHEAFKDKGNMKILSVEVKKGMG